MSCLYICTFTCCFSSEGDVRLMTGRTVSEISGRVEVYHRGQWGTVCSDVFNNMTSRVVCRQLGFVNGFVNLNIGEYGEGYGPIMLDDVRCHGSEDNLFSCETNRIMKHDCTHAQDAGVTCYVPGALCLKESCYIRK